MDSSSSRTTALHQPRQDRSPSPCAPQAPGLGPEAGPCDLVTVPARQGLEAVDILRLRDGVGPVLHDGECDTLGFLVPPGTADAWDVPGSACTQTHGRGLRVVPDEQPLTGAGWLVAPEAAFTSATDPAVLRDALGEAARTIAAVDRCR
ncbi:hypothetical protein [Streptomyces telluris]|uniref:Uncharacterized protein n=1 Tax=Streptomyces telluris TaxID=2720021 RepID=A0A9X2LH08_9ACTN|nr:hypothetical protein [Streptomyces telluris]MCQ8770707.1 hypothetical protein [Streptomyces telluris]